MATTKLTNHIRESILKDLLAYAFLGLPPASEFRVAGGEVVA